MWCLSLEGGSERVDCAITLCWKSRALCGWDGPWSYTLFPRDFLNRRKSARAKGFSSCLFDLLLRSCLSYIPTIHPPFPPSVTHRWQISRDLRVWIQSKMTSSDSHVAGNCFPSGLLVPFRHPRKAQPNLLFHLGRHYEWMTLIILYLDQLSTLDPICRFVEVAESSESVIIEPCQRLALAYITISVTACCTRDNGVDAKRQSTYKSRKLEED